MRIYAAQTESHLGKPDVFVEHNGEEIKWVVGAYEKRNIIDRFEETFTLLPHEIRLVKLIKLYK